MTGSARPKAITARIASRLREPAFWVIQTAVLVITAAHIALEAELFSLGLDQDLLGVHHLPVVLYIAPVAYAGLSYGWEGGVLTGLWAGALASINILVWHREGYEWVFEVIYVLIVIAMGVLMALPVERERRQRRRAEVAARRLETINRLVAAAGIPTRTAAEAVAGLLNRMVGLLDVGDAGAVLWRRGHSEPILATSVGGGLDLPARPPGGAEDGLTWPEERAGSSPIRIPVGTEHISGYLVVVPGRTGFDDEEHDLLVTVGHELAVRAENAWLLQQEQEMLSTYLRLVTEAQEEERRRLARDLHDGAAQQLAVLVRELQGQVAGGGEPWPALHRSAAEILEEVRRVARDQRPTLLDDLGLVPALEWLVAQIDRRSPAQVGLVVAGPTRRLSPEIEVALYRIAQEALHNAERHAEAPLIEVIIGFGEDEVELSVRDHGRGFQAPRSASDHLDAGRLGLMGMHERAQLVGGSLTIRSHPGKGTTVTVHVAPVRWGHDGNPSLPG